MVEMVKWIERVFAEQPDERTFPMILERLAGTPARIEEKISNVPRDLLTRRPGSSWSIQEHVGHLLDLEVLWDGRIDDFLEGKAELRAADMTNRKTYEANHNDNAIESLVEVFRSARSGLLARLEELDEAGVARTALHPRLKKPMRVIDLCSFVAEHDDHHLAKVSETWRALSGRSRVLTPRSERS